MRPNLILLLMTLLIAATSLPAVNGLVLTDVFVGGENGYHTYRIPSLVVTKGGTVLAFCEGRKENHEDNGNIDLLLKRSTDGGKSWGEQQIVWNKGGDTCGNPTPVLDQVTGTIWLFMTHNPGNVDTKILKTAGSALTRTVWVSRSDDEGRSWSDPVDLTATLKKPNWAWYATGPGIGIQLQCGAHKGRLVIPACHSQPGKEKARAHVIYSDDHGKTWQLGGVIAAGVSESQVVELADGRLLMNSRSLKGNRRSHSISKDGGTTWSTPKLHQELIEPICQGSIVRYSWPDAHQKSRILFSNPAHEQRRRNMTVRLSYDEGATWPVSKAIFAEWSAYSSLNVLPDQSIACLFEGGEERANDKIMLARFTLDWLIEESDKP